MTSTLRAKTHTDQSGKPAIDSSAPSAPRLAPMIPIQRPNSLPPRSRTRRQARAHRSPGLLSHRVPVLEDVFGVLDEEGRPVDRRDPPDAVQRPRYQDHDAGKQEPAAALQLTRPWELSFPAAGPRPPPIQPASAVQLPPCVGTLGDNPAAPTTSGHRPDCMKFRRRAGGRIGASTSGRFHPIGTMSGGWRVGTLGRGWLAVVPALNESRSWSDVDGDGGGLV